MKLALRRTSLVLFFLSLLVILVFVPVMARGLRAALPQSTSPTVDELSQILLVLYGAILSLVFTYVPEIRTWYEGLPHQGLVMLGFIVLIGAVYFLLSCTPYAAWLHIQIACTQSSLFDLIWAILAIAVGNQLTYLFAPTPSKPYRIR